MRNIENTIPTTAYVFDFVETGQSLQGVHDAMQFEYIPVILATLAAFGPHLIHPYFTKTKGRSTHPVMERNKLQKAYSACASVALIQKGNEGYTSSFQHTIKVQ